MNELRDKAGRKAVIVAVLSNCFLTVFNILIGIESGSYALVAEGAHTFSDVITSIIAFIGFKIAQKPADSEHHQGHGRAEAIAGLIISIFLAIVGYEVIKTALEKFLNPDLITVPSIYAALMAVFGILVNLLISTYIIKIGEEINSPAIVADGHHQRTDIFSSVAVLVGVVFANTGFKILDPVVGMIIGILILKTAYKIVKDGIDYIMGRVNDDALINKIKRITKKTPNAIEACDIKIDNYGAYFIVNLHVKVDENLTVKEANVIIENVEYNITKKIQTVKYVCACPTPWNTDDNDEKPKK